MRRLCLCIVMIFFPITAGAQDAQTAAIGARPLMRPAAAEVVLPPMRWNSHPESDEWTRSAVRALRDHGAPLTHVVPRDVDTWCPGYRDAGPSARRAFWVGFLSALAKHESTYRPHAVGGGGRWFGLLQILPATARHYGCVAGSGAALKDGGANLSCAIRILAVTVPRDAAIALKDGRWRGVAADWGPLRSESKRADMARWLRAQPYCAITRSPRPVARPALSLPIRMARD